LFFGLGDAIGIRLQGVYELDSRLILLRIYTSIEIVGLSTFWMPDCFCLKKW